MTAGDTAFRVGVVPRSGYPCILRVTDDDGLTGIDTLMVWASRARVLDTLPEAPILAAAASLDGLIYVLGGERNGQVSSAVSAYDPAAGTWTPKAPMPTARRSLAAAVLGGKIYASGGVTADGTVSRTLEIYDPVSDAWTSAPDMPRGRRSHSMLVVDAMLAVLLGRDASPDGDRRADLQMEFYRPGPGIWEGSHTLAIPSLEEAAKLRTAGVVGNRIVIQADGPDLPPITMGGRKVRNEVWILDGPESGYRATRIMDGTPPFDAYPPSDGHPMPSAVLDGILYTNRYRFAAIDVRADRRDDYGVPPAGVREHNVIGTANGKIYLIGGRGFWTKQPEFQVEELEPWP